MNFDDTFQNYIKGSIQLEIYQPKLKNTSLTQQHTNYQLHYGQIHSQTFHYKGSLHCGLAHGRGLLQSYPTKTKFKGNFVYGELNGFAQQFDQFDNLVYSGKFQHWKREGLGILYDPKKGNKIYQGYFKSDKFHGQGKLLGLQGKIVTGLFKQGKQDGLIEMQKQKEIFLGLMQCKIIRQNGKKKGYGVLQDLIKKQVYQGQFDNDKKNGFGILSKNNQLIYKGQFRQGIYNGIGIKYSQSNQAGIFYNGDKIK